MGGPGIAMDEREAASALRWWLEMGVDVAVTEAPRNWFDPARAAPETPVGEPIEASEAVPDTLEAFREWISASPQAPLSSKRSKPVLPVGEAASEVMVIAEPPGRDELAAAAPVGGDAGLLLRRMLAAIGMEDRAYLANLACFHSAGARLTDLEIEQCAAAARKHVALAKPQRLLLLGDLPSRALLAKPLLQARGHVHKIEGVRTIASFHPRQLLKRPSDKALAWKDLLLLVEEET